MEIIIFFYQIITKASEFSIIFSGKAAHVNWWIVMFCGSVDNTEGFPSCLAKLQKLS